ncbi:MAG: DUF6478 family protein [Celeribacter sp.]|jgi:hypothetical protein
MGKFSNLVDRTRQARTLRRWQRAQAGVAQMPLGQLRVLRQQARDLRRLTQMVISRADARLTRPRLGDDNIDRPLGCDWTCRPALWSEQVFPGGFAAVESRQTIGPDVTLFHDCATPELSIRQLRNTDIDDRAPLGARLDVLGFDGSFLSLVVDLPDSAVQGLRKSHIIRLAVRIEMEHPIKIFARLNVKHGPNAEQMVRELPLHDDTVEVEFDLAYSELNEKRAERMWLDVIFDDPAMNCIILRDLALTRRPRAEI